MAVTNGHSLGGPGTKLGRRENCGRRRQKRAKFKKKRKKQQPHL